MTTGGYILTSAIGGLISGAIGAAVANSSDSFPVLKGALVVGALDAVLAAAIAAGAAEQKQVGTSGVGELQREWGFP